MGELEWLMGFHILELAVCLSLQANELGNYINPALLFQLVMEKYISKLYFLLRKVTSLGRECSEFKEIVLWLENYLCSKIILKLSMRYKLPKEELLCKCIPFLGFAAFYLLYICLIMYSSYGSTYAVAWVYRMHRLHLRKRGKNSLMSVLYMTLNNLRAMLQ